MGNKVLSYAEFAQLMNVESFIARFETDDSLEGNDLLIFERFMSMNVASFLDSGGAFLLNDVDAAEEERLRTICLRDYSGAKGDRLEMNFEANHAAQCVELNILLPGGIQESSLILRPVENSPFLRAVGVMLQDQRFELSDFEVVFETTSLAEARNELSEIAAMIRQSNPELSESSMIMGAIVGTEFPRNLPDQPVIAKIQSKVAKARDSVLPTYKKPTLH